MSGPGSTDLTALLAGMTPRLRPGRYVFATLRPDAAAGRGAGAVTRQAELREAAVVTVAEDEGVTLVVPAEGACGLDAEYPCAWITLEVRSSLAAVGFLVVVCSRLAEVGISVNPVSGLHHDHLFVPWERRDEAIAVLEALAARTWPGECHARPERSSPPP